MFTEIRIVLLYNEEYSSLYSISQDSITNKKYLINYLVSQNGDRFIQNTIQLIVSTLCNLTAIIEIPNELIILADECGAIISVNLVTLVEQVINRHESPYSVNRFAYFSNSKYLFSVMLNDSTSQKRLSIYDLSSFTTELTPFETLEGYDFKIMLNEQEPYIIQTLPEGGSSIIRLTNSKQFENVIFLQNLISYIYFIPKNNITMHIQSNSNNSKWNQNQQLQYPLFLLDLNIVTQQLNVVYQQCTSLDLQQEHATYFIKSNTCSFSTCKRESQISTDKRICKDIPGDYASKYIFVLSSQNQSSVAYDFSQIIVSLLYVFSVVLLLVIVLVFYKCVQWQQLEILKIQKKENDFAYNQTEENLNSRVTVIEDNMNSPSSNSIIDFEKNQARKRLPNLQEIYSKVIKDYQNDEEKGKHIPKENLQIVRAKAKKILDLEDEDSIQKITIDPQEQRNNTQYYTEFFKNPTLINNTIDNIPLEEEIGSFQGDISRPNKYEKKQNKAQQQLIIDDLSSICYVNDDGQSQMRDYLQCNLDQNTLTFDQKTINYDHFAQSQKPSINFNNQDRAQSVIQQKNYGINNLRSITPIERQNHILNQQFNTIAYNDRNNSYQRTNRITPIRLQRKKSININTESQYSDLERLDIIEPTSNRPGAVGQNNRNLWSNNNQNFKPDHKAEEIDQNKFQKEQFRELSYTHDLDQKRQPSPLILKYVNQKIADRKYAGQIDVKEIGQGNRNNDLRRSRSMQLPKQQNQDTTNKFDTSVLQKQENKLKIEDKIKRIRGNRNNDQGDGDIQNGGLDLNQQRKI